MPPSELVSSYSDSFPALLARHGMALLVSTYEADRLVLIRSRGEELNTHFIPADRPMGVAVSQHHIAVGERLGIRQFTQASAALAVLEAGTDSAWLQRQSHVTGNIDVHELAWIGGALWAVNTRFSCLCTFDGVHSFVPRWLPPFLPGLASGDHCHLNGLAEIDGAPGVVSALGISDQPGGWRPGKAAGGVLIRVDDGELLATGLAMPHSPRVRDGELFFLESGRGALCVLNLASREVTTIAHLPGFTRGLSLVGNLAIVGLSHARESATFGALPITADPAALLCGIALVDLLSGEVLGLLRLGDAFAEVFSVEVLPGCSWPELIADDGSDAVAHTFILPG